MSSSRAISSYDALTFDCYGTLVDWEGGIHAALTPLVDQLPADNPLRNDRLALLKAFNRQEIASQVQHPAAIYSEILAATYGNLAAELGIQASEEDKTKFGASVGEWPVFPDTVEALKRLHKHFKLVILSNVDRESFNKTLAKQLVGVDFDAIYTAQDIGSYKPDPRNFEYLIKHCEKDLGVQKENILHTAQSLYHDHVPSKQAGLTSAWIERLSGFESVMGGDLAKYQDKVSYTWHFNTMGEMADAVDADADAKSS